MKPRLMLILLCVILLPVVVLLVSGVQIARAERSRVRETIRAAQLARLAEVSDSVSRTLAGHEQELLRVLDEVALDAESLRHVARSHRLVKQLFVIDPAGKLQFPFRDAAVSTQKEQRFLDRTDSLWSNGQTFYRPAESGGGQAAAYGWRTWFWEEGLTFLFWHRRQSGHIVGAELHRVTIVADMIGALPSSSLSRRRWGGTRIRLRDGGGRVLYEWGSYEPGEQEHPLAGVPLRAPLEAWRLQYYGDLQALSARLGRSATFNIASGVGVTIAAILALGILFYRASSREFRDATQRVSFVNQVSHELKTPLTNIRMYAELLDARLDPGDEKAKRQAEVVITECERLSRLIGNVLAFARDQRSGLKVRPRAAVVDDCVRDTLAHFKPSLTQKGIAVDASLDAPACVQLDVDALTQILANLFTNVEKYAADGGWMSVATEQRPGETTITVEDRGPGIPRKQRRRVFDPFVRLSNKLSDGVAGTGIGLSIARRLARLHGGDLELADGTDGARFILRIETDAA